MNLGHWKTVHLLDMLVHVNLAALLEALGWGGGLASSRLRINSSKDKKSSMKNLNSEIYM